uniref:RCC1-like domain-containing protein n=1 Tax=Picea sitchensis TaxID=3332 RepID=B8LNM4_PICSI|nr:unknown [Picea sitchensis]
MEVEEATRNDGQRRKVLLISAGASHTVALVAGNLVCSWGRGEDGQLGHGDAEDRPMPTFVSALDGCEITSVICGADHTTAYSDSRLVVYSWGWGDFGRLGHGNSSDLFIPHAIKTLQGLQIKQIACGDSHCLAVTINGEVQSWGRNQNGQLGVGDNIDHSFPQRVKLPAEEEVVQVSCGWRHTVAITGKSNVFSWGRGTSGQLGHGDILDRNMPVLIEALSVDGSACEQIQTSKTTVLSGSSWISPSERYAVVPDETGTGQFSAALESSVGDASVPDGDIKRVRTE